MTRWSLPRILAGLHDDIERRLGAARELMGHPVSKGDASESIWLELLSKYLPLRYRAEKAFVVDSQGQFSEQIDVVVFDRQYSPFIFEFEGEYIIPAESVYAVFEAKQTLNAGLIDYAKRKAASVRHLHRTSLPIPYAGGTYPPKPLAHILAGVLTFESDWNPPFGDSLREAVKHEAPIDRLDLGCVAAHGTFSYAEGERYEVAIGGKPATAFLLELIARLQAVATVPMIDVRAYAQWLGKDA